MVLLGAIELAQRLNGGGYVLVPPLLALLDLLAFLLNDSELFLRAVPTPAFVLRARSADIVRVLLEELVDQLLEATFYCKQTFH